MGTAYPMQSLVISHQPASSRGMEMGSGAAAREGEQQVDDGAMRLRGGCIPLPVSLFEENGFSNC